MSKNVLWRSVFVILGITITFAGLILWNIPLNESDGAVNIYSADSGWNFGEGALPLIGNGFLLCFGVGPYIIFSGLAGAPLFLSKEAWNQKPPELE
tara:strand:+ start:2735 stop:3022 length:288 start_codon:yes stop_codon:yes gene_type:complete